MRRFLEEHEIDHPVILDSGKIWRAYAIREPPAAILISEGGRLVRGWPGGVNKSELARALETQLRPEG